MRRPYGHFVVIALLLTSSVNAFSQVANEVRDPEPGSVALGLMQGGIGAAGLNAVVGLWRRTRWATAAILAWGVIAAALVVLLQPLLGLDASERNGLLIGAAAVLMIAGVVSFYVHRSLRLPAAGEHDR